MEDALNQLSDRDYQQRRQAYTTVPDHALPRRKYSDRTANRLTGAIVRFLQLQGHTAWRQSSEGRYRPGERITDVLGHSRQLPGTYLPGTNRGHGDISAVIRGHFVSIEIKVGRDKQRKDQKRFEADIRRSGGHYFIATSYEQFQACYQELITTLSV